MFPVSVKRWRDEAGLNQEEAAANAGVVQSQWAKWESASYGQPKRATCIKIARALNISDEVVLAAAGYDTALPGSQLAQEIAIEEERVPAERRGEFRTMVRQLVKTTASVMSSAA